MFLLGIYKSYEELEDSLSMPELTAILKAVRDKEAAAQRFAAALKGIDLEKDKGQKEWEDMKARVASRGTTSDSNDIMSMQGQNAKTAGFGIGMGMEAEVINEQGEVTKLG